MTAVYSLTFLLSSEILEKNTFLHVTSCVVPTINILRYFGLSVDCDKFIMLVDS